MAKGRRRPQGHPARVADQQRKREMRRRGIDPDVAVAYARRHMEVLRAIDVIEWSDTTLPGQVPGLAWKLLLDRGLSEAEADAEIARRIEQALDEGRLAVGDDGKPYVPRSAAA